MDTKEILDEVAEIISDSGWVLDDYDEMDGFVYVTIRKRSKNFN